MLRRWGILVGFLLPWVFLFVLLYQYVELTQHYEWALELSRIPVEERKEIVNAVINQPPLI